MRKDEYRANGRVFLSVAKAAAILGVSTESVRKRCRDGSLRAIKIGSQWFVHIPAPSQTKTKQPQRALKDKATLATPVPMKIAQRLISRLPTAPVSSLPAAYAKSLPMIVGVLTVLAIAFLAGHPTLSNARVRIAEKTDTLVTDLAATASAGVTSLRDVVTAALPVLPPRQGQVDASRPAALGRTLARGSSRVEVLPRVTEVAYTVSSAAAALYSIELLATDGE
ncbi:MAG: Helix-turn-helix domain [Candidatus Parcubacteria bacterium]